MYQNDERFARFRELLEKEGFTLRALGSAKVEGESRPSLFLFQVMGDGNPACRTVFVRIYGQQRNVGKTDGFGIWFEDQHGRFEETARALAGRMANVGELVDEEERYSPTK